MSKTTSNPEFPGEPYEFINPSTTDPEMQLLLRGARIVETDRGVTELSPGADFLLRSLLRNRDWTTRGDIYADGFEPDLPEDQQKALRFAWARRKLSTVTFGPDQQSVLMIDDTGEVPEYRLHNSLTVSFEPKAVVGANKLPRSGRAGRGSGGPTGSGYRGRRSNKQEDAEQDPVRIYLNQIGAVELITKAEEERLAKIIEKGVEAATRVELAESDPTQKLSTSEYSKLQIAIQEGEAARETFTKANLRLVVSIAKRYQASGLPLLDLIQEGNMGLMHAIEKFDYRKGFKFSTYATWWIRQAITRGVANTGRTIRVPVHAGDLLGNIYKARLHIEATNGYGPISPEDIAVELGVPVAKVIDAMLFEHEPLSLDDHIKEDADVTLGGVVASKEAGTEEQAMEHLLPDEIARMLGNLDQRERGIVVLRFGLEDGESRSLEEIGKQFSLTRERVRQIEARALAKLRHPSGFGETRLMLLN